jgi:hypothetical protein
MQKISHFAPPPETNINERTHKMSIESVLEENTAALLQNTAAIKELMTCYVDLQAQVDGAVKTYRDGTQDAATELKKQIGEIDERLDKVAKLKAEKPVPTEPEPQPPENADIKEYTEPAAPAPEPVVITAERVRAVLVEIVENSPKGKGRDNCKVVLAEVGAERLSDVPPEKLADLHKIATDVLSMLKGGE